MKTNKIKEEKKYKSMKDYLKEHPEDEEVREELEAYEQGYQQATADLIKMIDDFGKLRLYRSKSCQLLLRRLKQPLKELGEKQ